MSGQALIIGKEIEVVSEVNSTNAYAKENLRKNLDSRGDWVFTEKQRSGPGAGRHRWASDSKHSLTASFVVKPQPWPGKDSFWPVRAQRLFAVCVQDSLQEFVKKNVLLKWPNDVYLDGKKVGGMLLENGWQNGQAMWTICGLGLNLSSSPAFPTESSHLDAPIPALEFLQTWGGIFAETWKKRRLQSDDVLLQDYLKVLWGFHSYREFELISTGEVFGGTAVGVDEQNRIELLVQGIQGIESRHYEIKSIRWR